MLQDVGQVEQARDLLQQALTSLERSFEPGHPDLAIRQSSLAMVLHDLGQLEQARDLLQQALASLEEKLGPAHPSVIKVRAN